MNDQQNECLPVTGLCDSRCKKIKCMYVQTSIRDLVRCSPSLLPLVKQSFATTYDTQEFRVCGICKLTIEQSTYRSVLTNKNLPKYFHSICFDPAGLNLST